MNIAEKSSENEECGVYAFSSLILPFLEWWGLDFLRRACGRLVSWSKYTNI